MNPYLKNLNKLEFVVTYACTGRCKHCSEGDHTNCRESLDEAVAAEAVRATASACRLQTVMAFGGEPLLYPGTVYAVMHAAREAGVPRRQLITNGCFSREPEVLHATAHRLWDCGVNDLLISVDAFHQETLPLDVVRSFAAEAVQYGIPARLQPAWLVSATDDNPYNQRTRDILRTMADLGIPTGEGNVVFPEGNALKYLAEYFTDSRPPNPYEENPRDVRCLSVAPNGDVLGGNIYRQSILEIMEQYAP